MTAKYTMLTLASCEPSFSQEALDHIATLVGELKEKAGCIGARFGVAATGSDAGSLILYQNYAELGDIEKVFDVYAQSSAYQSIINSGKTSVTLHNIIKLEDVQLHNPSKGAPKFSVVTLIDAPKPPNERLRGLVPIFEQHGAMLMLYGTVITGSHAGKRLMEVTYRSMDAIEKTYDALRASGDYQKLMNEVTLVRRNIMRLVG